MALPSSNLSQGETIEEMLLQEVDDRQELYKQLTSEHQTEGIVVIFILDILPKNQVFSSSVRSSRIILPITPTNKFNIIKHARNVLEQNHIFEKDVFTLVKHDEHRMFVLCKDPIIAMERMIAANHLIRDEFASTPSDKNETAKPSYPLVSVTLAGGCEAGHIFEFTNDFFGDPVNVASKLAEDTAKPGELLVSFGGNEKECISQIKSKATFKRGSTVVSSVHIEYFSMRAKVDPTTKKGSCIRAIIPWCCCASSSNTPILDMKEKSKAQSTGVYSNVHNDEKLSSPWEDAVLVSSDLSGFTRLTKKYGILHIMTIILNCREIFKKNIIKYNGQILKFDGDNTVCKFKSSDDALRCCAKMSKDISAYNSGKELDFHIRIKLSMSKGLIFCSDDGEFILGYAWEQCYQLGEHVAEVGEILITDAVMDDLKESKNDYEFDLRPETDKVDQHYNVVPKQS